MKTLVYIASGEYRKEYEFLDYDRVYLVDTALRNRVCSDKVKLLRCDALEAVEHFKKEGIVIDCLVCLCESVGEGGQTYAVCSDAFMGYAMPVLAKDFLWICNDIQYYPGLYRSTIGQRFGLPGSGIRENPYGMHSRYGFNHVSLDLPYSMQELTDGDPEYIPPTMFSRLLSEHNRGHVYRMRFSPSIETFVLSPGISIRLIQDSIWNHYDELDHLFISFKLGFPPMKDFFERKEKVSYYKQMEFRSCLQRTRECGFAHVGFSPHYWYQYDRNYQKGLEDFIRELDRPMTIDFFYLNSRFHTKHIKKAVKTLLRELPEDVHKQ